jgi:hypothetical protein
LFCRIFSTQTGIHFAGKMLYMEDEMPINEDAIIDEEFIKRFKEQTAFLENLEKQVHDAVQRAKGRIAKMQPGKSMKEVFDPLPPKQSPAAQRGGGVGSLIDRLDIPVSAVDTVGAWDREVATPS